MLKEITNKSSSFLRYTLLTIALLSVGFFAFNKKSNSPIILSAGYLDDSSFCIDFRENETYKIRYHSIVSSKIIYGKYKMKDKLIILKKPIEIGRFKLRDTMFIEGEYINYGLLNSYPGEKYTKFPITNFKERCVW